VERRKKILLAAVVLVVGVVLALQFRKSEIIKSHFSPGAASRTETTADSASNRVATVSPQNNSGSPGATAFDGGIEAAPGSSAGQLDGASRSIAGAPDADNRSSSTPGTTPSAGPLVNMNAPEQTHTIVDGDTLQSLSQHYLGRADRYMELFQYNRDVLRNPDVLPIGAELRIPSQVALPPISDATALPLVPTAPITPLVPLPSAPPTATGKSALPASAQKTGNGQRPAPRTYTVQAGDNLIDIARKFYGDGRRYESLYEANRRVMHNPTDLKPGMVLMVP
jgi:nucleoid-associated protein YgaU